MNEKNNVLHLDDMLGKRDIKVEWKDNQYALKGYADLSSEEYMEVMSLGEKFVGYKDITKTEKLSKDILVSVNRIMEIIAPELAELKLSFSGQMLVLTFWKEQQDDPTKKKRAKAN